MAKSKTPAVKDDNRPATGRGGKYNFPAKAFVNKVAIRTLGFVYLNGLVSVKCCA